MSLFRLDASIKIDGSASKELADIIEEHWADAHPAAEVVRRHIGLDPLPSDAWATAVSTTWTPEAERSEAQHAAASLARRPHRRAGRGRRGAARASRSTTSASPSTSRPGSTWCRPTRAPLPRGLLADKPTVLATVRGGAYGAGTPREGWDHSTGYLRRILEDHWQADLTVVEREFTLVGVNPALDAFTDLGHQMREDALSAADEAGRVLAKAR